MINRPRRLRENPLIRGMVRETRASKDSLIYPIFFEEGKDIKAPISAMDGQFRYSPDRAKEIIDQCLAHGVSKVLLFGIPKEKDEMGSQAYAENGIVQQAVRAIKEEYKEQIYVITDVCMCEYTSHGHCGILCGHDVDNDQTLEYLSATAVSHAAAGADMVAPSDMMDREAAGSAPSFGDRKTYQMDPHNVREAMKEAALDEAEGADILMVKPALSYLDIIKELSYNTNLPIATYSVSGEYAMIKNAGKAGLVDEYGIMCETATSMYRAGSDIIMTYYAMEIADAIQRGDIG